MPLDPATVLIYANVEGSGESSNLDLESVATDPQPPNVGRIWYNTAENHIKAYINKDGTTVTPVSIITSSDIIQSSQTITLTGDVTGSGTGSFATTLANSGVAAGTYKSVTVDAKGRVTGGSNPTTLSGYGITDGFSWSYVGAPNGAAPLDANSKVPAANLPLSNLTDIKVAGRIDSTGRLLIGDSINSPNIANVWVLNSSSGTTADRTVTIVDSIGTLKVVRASDTNNPAVELQEWNAALTTQRGYWDWASVNGDFIMRDRLGGATNPRLGINRTTGTVSTYGSLDLPNTQGTAIQINGAYGWCDLVGDVVPRTNAALKPYIGNFQFNTYGVGDNADARFHMPHDYAPGTDLFIHLHWSHNGTAISGSLNVALQVAFAKGFGQGRFNTLVNTSIVASGLTITNCPQYVHKVTEIQISSVGGGAAFLNTSDLEVDGMILATITTNTIPSITGSPTNNNTPYIFFMDLHYQSTSLSTKNKAPNFYI